MKFTELPTPCFLIDENKIVQNLAVLRDVAERSGAKILLAQKAFSMYTLYPLIAEYLSGTTASGLYEARLGHTYFGGETHVYSPAFAPGEFDDLLPYADHFIFNSMNQWKIYGTRARAAGKSCGLRVNPECSTQPAEHALYDPCGPFSRLGVTADHFRPELLDGLDGLHFHTLCEQNSDDLVRTVAAFDSRFGKFAKDMKWLNLGGGHHITRDDYDIEVLVECVKYLRKKYDVEVYLEPGEAVVLNAGYLVSTVLEIVENHAHIAILDTSAACHMPDVIEMPYRPPVWHAAKPHEKAFNYLLTGRSCLAGDVVGEYSFDNMLRPGDQVVFEDMALYTMVKTNTFNGVPLPSIALRRADGTDEIVKTFDYEDFKSRLS